MKGSCGYLGLGRLFGLWIKIGILDLTDLRCESQQKSHFVVAGLFAGFLEPNQPTKDFMFFGAAIFVVCLMEKYTSSNPPPVELGFLPSEKNLFRVRIIPRLGVGPESVRHLSVTHLHQPRCWIEIADFFAPLGARTLRR